MTRVTGRRSGSGFTLLEVMVALFILAIVAVTVSQGVHQRTRASLVETQRVPLILCARALGNEFTLTRYWPSTGRHEGQFDQAGQTCFWRLDVGSTPVRNMRRGTLSLFDEAAREHADLSFTLFFSP
ncbi:type II secretion system protein [Halomonas sp. McH1-25]|uniref:type II secretion system protein n=1 Tax=unclassified Halomonas TaxID=2609666 RepID=UPI001EF5A316|nr:MULTISPECIES: type II secretion system protein [unclassified Halomonas]MCG7601617.1 type II secretion system protein [Halomonas sp. McH1-25]MCP1342262.1 type II secretion system protein [Halomonas sp. FL8]MCP1363338.1 type II secretion system protein [Halomonas sp. BBD45]MCP1366734.1 type II secretion system protein [Halomonas sp. BBD48]